ncbi:MAG: maturase [Chloroflexi bacterium]|nr:maturase [Chloroflexota bacterium]
MRNADTILAVIHDRGIKRLPLERVYRLLFNRDLFLKAYGRIYRNAGALTPGATVETVDGMSLAKIDAIIAALRDERYRWTPVRRVYIEKPNSTKMRPLGLPTWSDKLVQEAIRLILEAYYEPQFSEHSHGFRPSRGCHTALGEIRRTWTGTVWFIEGDISQCFDRLDHGVLRGILAESIHDGRFLALIDGLLKAGYLEDWRYHATLSGSPQGGVVSPILANICLDRFDRWVETTLLPAHNRADRRRDYRPNRRLIERIRDHRKAGQHGQVAALQKQARQLPTYDPFDPDYRRLRFARYADDWLLGFAGPRAEAEEIKRQIAGFLRDTLKLELNEAKTLITHARTASARFLGYQLEVFQDNRVLTQSGRRRLNGSIGLTVPVDVVGQKCALYTAHGTPIHRAELLHESVFSIVALYQAEYRGIVEYYRLAYNIHRFNRLKWVMEQSLTKTLASKLNLSVPQVYDRFGAVLQTPNGRYKGLRVTVERPQKQPLVAIWGGVSLKRTPHAILKDDVANLRYSPRAELEQRLLASECELCGSQDQVQVHHVRRLSDLRRPGQGEKPLWVRTMAARQRKTLVVCRACHVAIHAGRPTRPAAPRKEAPS